jgi:hypothetical protein
VLGHRGTRDREPGGELPHRVRSLGQEQHDGAPGAIPQDAEALVVLSVSYH